MQKALAPLALTVYANALKLENDNAAIKGGCPYGFSAAQTTTEQKSRKTRTTVAETTEPETTEPEATEPEATEPEDSTESAVNDMVSDFFNLDGAVETTPETFTVAEYEEVFNAVIGAFDWENATFSDNDNSQGRFVGCLLRTAGHDFMDYRGGETEMGGSDGCINMNDPDNVGLEACLNKWGMPAVFDSVKDHVSLADFFVIAGEASAARAHPGANPADMFEEGSLA